jgi:cytoskeletal protein RodZ
MTINQSRRAPTRRTAGFRPDRGSSSNGNGRSSVGEQLREAREVRGLDLFRVERDTKIRTKYLEALESGDFGDLPGEVYTRGFLRNYATYLGLDADEMVDEWRREAGETQPVKPPRFAGPQPLRIRRGVVFQRSHLIILVVVLIVAAVGSYFGYQVTRFLQYPTVGVSDPSGQQTLQVPAGSTSYVLKGSATAGTSVLISWDGQDSVAANVDGTGHWTYTAQLHSGSNQFDITAMNLDTNHASKTSRVIIIVPVVTPSPPEPEVAFAAPADQFTSADGAVTVTGTSVLVANVVLTETYLGPPPLPGATFPPTVASPLPGASVAPGAGASPSALPTASAAPGGSAGPSPSAAASPNTAKPGADGTFSFSVQLQPGLWQLTVVGQTVTGKTTAAVTRTIAVQFKGISVTVNITGGDACLSYFVDGVNSQGCQPDGYQFSVTATKSFCILVSGRPNLVFLTYNGTSLGSIDKYGGKRVYIDLAKGPRNVNVCS